MPTPPQNRLLSQMPIQFGDCLVAIRQLQPKTTFLLDEPEAGGSADQRTLFDRSNRIFTYRHNFN